MGEKNPSRYRLKISLVTSWVVKHTGFNAPSSRQQQQARASDDMRRARVVVREEREQEKNKRTEE